MSTWSQLIFWGLITLTARQTTSASQLPGRANSWSGKWHLTPPGRSLFITVSVCDSLGIHLFIPGWHFPVRLFRCAFMLLSTIVSSPKGEVWLSTLSRDSRLEGDMAWIVNIWRSIKKPLKCPLDSNWSLQSFPFTSCIDFFSSISKLLIPSLMHKNKTVRPIYYSHHF